MLFATNSDPYFNIKAPYMKVELARLKLMLDLDPIPMKKFLENVFGVQAKIINENVFVEYENNLDFPYQFTSYVASILDSLIEPKPSKDENNFADSPDDFDAAEYLLENPKASEAKFQYRPSIYNLSTGKTIYVWESYSGKISVRVKK